MGLLSSKDKDGNMKITMAYLSGLPENYKPNRLIYLVLNENTNTLQFKKSLKKEECVNLSLSKVTGCGLVTEEKIIHVSGVGRAITGGLLFGSTGAIVGALTAEDKVKKKSHFGIAYNSNGEEKVILLNENGDIHTLKFFNHLKKIVYGTLQKEDAPIPPVIDL